MASTRRSVKRVKEEATDAVNNGQEEIIWSHTAPNYSPNHRNQGCSLPLTASKRRPFVYARPGRPRKKQTQYGDLADNSQPQLQNAHVQLCGGVDVIQSSEAVIPAKEPKHEKEASNQAGMSQECSLEQMEDTIILDSKEFDKFHSSGQLDHHKTMAGTDVTTSRGGNTVASNHLNGAHGEISTRGFLGNGPQKTASFNLTEIAENMCNDDLDEVDSLGTETISVGGYKVKRKYGIRLGHILAKHGDIGVNCCRTDKFRSFYMELLCDIVEKLMDTDIITIRDEDVGQMIKDTEDLEKENLNIGWLKERLNSIREGRQAIQVLNSSSYEKKCHAVLQAEVKKRGKQLEDYKCELAPKEAEVKKRVQQLEDYKRELAAKQVEVQDLKKVILAAEHDIVKTKEWGHQIR